MEVSWDRDTPKSSVSRWDFPYKPTSYWGTPMTMETPILYVLWFVDQFTKEFMPPIPPKKTKKKPSGLSLRSSPLKAPASFASFLFLTKITLEPVGYGVNFTIWMVI